MEISKKKNGVKIWKKCGNIVKFEDKIGNGEKRRNFGENMEIWKKKLELNMEKMWKFGQNLEVWWKKCGNLEKFWKF